MSQTPKAFPINDGHLSSHGMDLRDYFAAKAMQGWLASYGADIGHPACSDDPALALRLNAEHAYAMADAMLRARSAPPMAPKAVK